MKEISTLCRNVRSVIMNAEALKSFCGLEAAMKERGYSVHDVSKLTGIKAYKVQSYVSGLILPTIRTYNRLARVFGWDMLHEKAPTIQGNAKPKQKMTELNVSTSCRKFTFTSGKKYVIKCQSGTLSEQAEYVFMYEGRQGIHHVFRELNGNWTRTYTDAQLIGKKLYELEDEM
ncbi:MAG: helix-turn-helix transcriptional regulator [Synergistaceae bacterium]|nr:helix-turn-helix transcriptional regulator [Synergistaceae bacterium]